MSKGPKIKEWVKWLISFEALKTRAEPRDSVAQRIEEYLVDKEAVPSRETLNKMISKARNHPVSPLDEQWSVAALAQHDIPAEALPAVLYIYAERQRKDKIDFTIREALWVGRLHKVIDDLDFLERFASAYAVGDKIAWILDIPPYSQGFDYILLNYLNPERRAEVISELTEFPWRLNPFPSSMGNKPISDEEVTEKLRQKGYNIETPGMVALRKDVEQLWLEELPKMLGQLKRQWGQKGYVMTPDEESFRNWVEQKWPSVLKEFIERNKQRKGGTK